MADFSHHESCPACSSSDALARYNDGSAYCFSCTHHEKAGSTTHEPTTNTKKGPTMLHPIPAPQALARRGIAESTCEKWRYGCAVVDGRPAQIATYFNDAGAPVAQKIRFADKSFTFPGGGDAPLYGQHLWRDGGKRIVITEGEIDAMSVDQALGGKWPVVSVPNGAQGARKALARSVQWLNRFDEIVLMFDMDDPGRAAVEECATLFPPGKVSVATLPMKDANEMLQAGKTVELRNACWEAKHYRPDGILRVADLAEDLMREPTDGIPWPWPTLTKYTFGRRLGELYAFGAGTGVGKTDILSQIIAQTIGELELPVATFFLEQSPRETVQRIAGKMCERRFHIPKEQAGWNTNEYQHIIAKLSTDDRLYVYDSFGATEWDAIKSRIRFLVHNYGVRDIFLDHLTALAAAADDERTALEKITCEMSMLAKELQFRFYFVSHLCTPEGRPHEEGGRVMIRHFKGSRAIGFWSHFMFGLERDQQAEDLKERGTTTFRVLKDRYTGGSVGKVMKLTYNQTTGMLGEADGDPFGDCPLPDTNQGAF